MKELSNVVQPIIFLALAAVLFIWFIIGGVRLFQKKKSVAGNPVNVKKQWPLPAKRGAWLGCGLGFIIAIFWLSGGSSGHIGIPPIIFLPIVGPLLAAPGAVIGGIVGYFLRSGWKLDR